MNHHSEDPTTRLNKKTKISTDLGTFIAVCGFIVVATGMYFDIRHKLDDVSDSLKTTIHVDDMDRFGTQIRLLNPTLPIVMPETDKYVRHSETVANYKRN